MKSIGQENKYDKLKEDVEKMPAQNSIGNNKTRIHDFTCIKQYNTVGFNGCFKRDMDMALGIKQHKFYSVL